MATLWLGAFVLLVAANAFFVAAEFSLVTVDRALIAQQAATDRRARTVLAALRTLSFQLSGAQLGITITALLTGYLAEPALGPLLKPVLPVSGTVIAGITLVIATLLSMLFGELLPKNAALANPMPTARWTAPGQRAFSALFSWLIRLLNSSANWVVRRLGVEPQEELASARSPEELGLLAAISARAGALPRDTALLLQRTIRFGDKRAAAAMTPRIDVVALSADASVADLLHTSLESGHSRFPVYVETLDQIIGVATVTDALSVPLQERATTPVRAVATEPMYVPEHLDLDSLLDALRESDVAFAVVVDEYGGTDGVVTIEDLVEELVGEIADEHDEPDAQELEALAGITGNGGVRTPAAETDPEARQAWLVSGVLREDELAEQTGFHLPTGPYETLAGFIMAQLGHIPVEGETMTHQGWEFTVTAVDRHRVEQVRVVPPASWHPSEWYFPADAQPGQEDSQSGQEDAQPGRETESPQSGSPPDDTANRDSDGRSS
ncbi:MAG: hemolysin family protein [Micromonosporaceae bacterium]